MESDTSVGRILIAHEVVHALIYGLRAEARASGQGRLSLERLYTQLVPAAQWPHIGTDSNEQLATEIGVWALGIPRTPEVSVFRSAVLQPAVASGAWAGSLTRHFAPPKAGR